jgi:hypothetical protein
MKTYAYALAATLVAFPAAALEHATGSFGFVPKGPVTLDTGDITSSTTEVLFPQTVKVNTISGDNNLPLALGDLVALSGPFETVPGPTSLVVDINGLEFTFTETTSVGIIPSTASAAGFLFASYIGTLSDGANLFFEGTPVALSLSCDEVRKPAVVNCSDTVAQIAVVPEPGSLAILGAALIGLGIMSRSKRRAS